VTDARPSESLASERSAFKAATAGCSSELGFELAEAVVGCAIVFELTNGCVVDLAGVIVRVGLGILVRVLTIP